MCVAAFAPRNGWFPGRPRRNSGSIGISIPLGPTVIHRAGQRFFLRRMSAELLKNAHLGIFDAENVKNGGREFGRGAKHAYYDFRS
jgi:hypothetical protein